MPCVFRVLGPEEIDFGGPGATALEEGWEEGIIIQRSTCMWWGESSDCTSDVFQWT